MQKDNVEQIRVDFYGIVGDHRAGVLRKPYEGDRESKGTMLRNDRQLSGVANEALLEIGRILDLADHAAWPGKMK